MTEISKLTELAEKFFPPSCAKKILHLQTLFLNFCIKTWKVFFDAAGGEELPFSNYRNKYL